MNKDDYPELHMTEEKYFAALDAAAEKKYATGIADWSSCDTCIHDGDNSEEFTCKAFPVRIPAAIVVGLDKHTSPHPGDHGIQYEPSRH